MNQALGIIIARAGSKGLPRKNALPIAGRPCAAWTLDAARDSATIASLCFSTDDPELLGLARQAGATAIERPPELASDSARVDDAARHALQVIAQRDPRWMQPDAPVVILYANVPVRPPDLIDRAVRLLCESGADSVQSYARVGKNHPWWTARVDERSGRVAPWEGSTLNHNVYRRQDLPPAYVPDAGVLAVTRRALMLEIPGVAPGPHAFFGLDRRAVLTGEGDVVDIDTRIDLYVAEAVLSRRAARTEQLASPVA